ncbi:DUF2799 domain-containing protein [Vibrio sp. YIC-376]|uniref:DUF2799 domain-containing protein n=1 Tax=Vibrio sp. YIC-376 TaxID=3136162 RepID=UPI00402A9C8A
MKFPLLIMLSLTLIGCSTGSEQSMLAQSGEWHSVGVIDGQQGHYQRAKVELTALNNIGNEGFQQYKQGYSQGISDYCSPENAYKHGDAGVRYSGQCANTEFEDLTVEKWQSAYTDYVSIEAMLFEF